MKARTAPYLAQVAILFGIYFLTAKFGLGMDPVSGFAAAVWPPTGISLVALTLFGYRLWPGITLAAFLVNASVLHATLLSAGGMAAGNTLEAVLGAFLLRRADFRPSLDRIRDVLALVIGAAMLSTLVSPTIGVTSGWLWGAISSAKYGQTWWTWWVGDMMGDLVLAALLFAWSGALRNRLFHCHTVEAGALLLSLVVASLLVFGDRFSGQTPFSPYLFFPLLIWAALRFDPRGVVTGTFVISSIAVWGTAHGSGPFARATENESLVALETFMGVVAVTAMVLAANVSERRQAEEELRGARAGLEKRVQERTAELVQVNTELGEEIRERQRADECLRRSERLLAEAQQMAHVGSWEWDIAGNTITWSEELYRIYGLEPGKVDLTYESYLAHVHPEEREFVKDVVARSSQDHQPFEFDHRVVRPDGTERWVHGQGAVILSDAGQPIRMLGTGQDITERKRVQDELRRAHDELEVRVQERTADLENADRAKDQFLAMLAHELRNPLASIRNAAKLLKLLGPAEPRVTRSREIIERQVNHQARLLDDLLNVSRIARGKIDLECERLDLRRLVRDTVEDYRSLLEEAGLTLDLSLPEGPVWVEADPTRLAQVLGNLLQNAAKFTERGGEVGVGCWVLGVGSGTEHPTPNTQHPIPTVALTVRDTGIGMEPALLPHLFEPFTQADRSLDRSRGGLGLGLALVKGLVELHGGEVRAESDGEGRGAEFTILLPTVSTPPAPESAPARIAPRVSPLRILIVEDNPEAAETLRDLLEALGWTVQVAYSGPEAVSVAPRFRPEVVLCDLGLPGMDGFQVAAELRRNPVTAGARLIAVSGYGQEEDLQRSQEAGFELHLTKPIDLDALQRLLEAGPERREGERDRSNLPRNPE